MKKRIDPFTKEEFIPIRNNQIYANRKNQITHNNFSQREKHALTKKINDILYRNREICLNIIANDDSKSHKVSVQYLKAKGFDFRYFTSSLKKDNKIFQCIYDIKILIAEENNFLISKLN